MRRGGSRTRGSGSYTRLRARQRLAQHAQLPLRGRGRAAPEALRQIALRQALEGACRGAGVGRRDGVHEIAGGLLRRAHEAAPGEQAQRRGVVGREAGAVRATRNRRSRTIAARSAGEQRDDLLPGRALAQACEERRPPLFVASRPPLAFCQASQAFLAAWIWSERSKPRTLWYHHSSSALPSWLSWRANESAGSGRARRSGGVGS